MDRGGTQSGLSDLLYLFMRTVLCFTGLISNTFWGCRATLFNDHGCGYPVFGQINHKLAPLKTNLFCPCLFKRHSISQALCSAWFVVSLGFACWRYAGLWSFWPLALVQQAQAAIFFVVLRSLGGAVLFRSSCPSPNSGYRFWLLALTFRSSRPAYGGRLTSPVRQQLMEPVSSSRPLWIATFAVSAGVLASALVYLVALMWKTPATGRADT